MIWTKQRRKKKYYAQNENEAKLSIFAFPTGVCSSKRSAKHRVGEKENVLRESGASFSLYQQKKLFLGKTLKLAKTYSSW